MTGERSRRSPSRHDRGGAKRRKAHANAEHMRTGLVLYVATRGAGAMGFLSAHTRRTLAAVEARTPWSRGGTPAKRPTPRDLELVPTRCRCGRAEIPIARDMVEAEYVPRCPRCP